MIALHDAKFVLNSSKTKVMFFSHKPVSAVPDIKTLQGDTIEVEDSYKYLVFLA